MAHEADQPERAAGEQKDRAIVHLSGEVHGGERLPRPGRPVEQDAALQMTARVS